MFSSDYLLPFGFKPVQDDLQHDFARMTYEADGYVVLAEHYVAILGCVIISDLVHEVGHSPSLQILLQFSVKTSIINGLSVNFN